MTTPARRWAEYIIADELVRWRSTSPQARTAAKVIQKAAEIVDALERVGWTYPHDEEPPET